MRTLLIGWICLWPALSFAQPAPVDPFETPPEEPAPIVDSAAVRAIRQSKPATPEQLFDAIQMLIDLDRTDLAKEYLQQLAGLPLDTAALARLHEQFGTADMIRLSRTAELAPEGVDFASQVVEAAKALAYDPQRIATHIHQLASDQRETQVRAAAGLMRSGAFAVAPLIKAIAESEDVRLTKNAQYVLARLGNQSVDPLLAFLSSSDPRLRTATIESLGRLGSARALPYLVRPLLTPAANGDGEQRAAATAIRQKLARLPSRAEAMELLSKAAQRGFAGQTDVAPDIDGLVVTWTWDEASQTVAPFHLFQSDAAAVSASRLYRDLSSLAPDNRDYLVRYLIAKLEFGKSRGGLDTPLQQGPGTAHELASQAGTEVLQQVLAGSLETGHRAAAQGAMQVLGSLSDPSVLSSTTGLSPVAQGLINRDRRVRFAAAEAIIKLNPAGSFPGASRVTDALGFFAASTGHRGILVAHPSRQRGRTIAGLAAEAGFSPESVTNATNLLRRAKALPDWELVLISDELPGSSTWSLIELLRADPRTAELPIVLMTEGDDEALFRLENIVDSTEQVLAILEPAESVGVATAITRALEMAGRRAVDRDRRMDQAVTALQWMKQLADQQSKMVVDLKRQEDRLIDALYTGELSQTAADILARIGSPRAQLALADLASQTTLPMAQREAAAHAFELSSRSFGNLMTSDEIRRQYDRYNASRGLDAQTQQILGALLDSIEAPLTED